MSQGTVKWFNEQKGFGFISGDDGSEYFVHHTGLTGEGFKTLEDGVEVEFEIEESEKGPRAVQVSEI